MMTGDRTACYTQKPGSAGRRRKRRYDKRAKKKLKAIADAAGMSYMPSGAYFDKKKGRYVRYYRGRASAFFKKQSSKKVRKMKELPNGKAGYKKAYDYWWALY